ncbi:hypothetical protein HEP81_03724 [Streptomyces griseofuscus]|uniref:Uncharacterized protein n=1 Tax=Streptomyces griseofuscus TaxID=146922 RepID=A0A7H1Q142_9ACTN|nr:hypothetical protein HEP81_03724 [Streptomyces griseofuscus]BBC94686.1 hypothetical protein SRO_3510 [Streptomyces rochei]
MRATKHAAPQPRRRRGPGTGIPSGLLVVGALVLPGPDRPHRERNRYKAGPAKWWCGIQVIGHRNPVAALEVRTAGGCRQLPRTVYDYFLSADGTG